MSTSARKCQGYPPAALPEIHPESISRKRYETVIGLFKTQVINRRGPWRSFETVEFATLEWVNWFNTRCLPEPIGNIPPAEAEARYFAQIEAQALTV